MADVASPPPTSTTMPPSTEPTEPADTNTASTHQEEAETNTSKPSTALTTSNKILSTTVQADGSTLQIELTPAGKKVKKLLKKKQRPARVQIEAAALAKNREAAAPQTGAVFNIWYNKWSGGDSGAADALESSTPAPTRVDIRRDSGYTAADGVRGAPFCLFFARGTCPHGRACAFLHRLPDSLFDLHSGQSDVFGREKHADYRDDMGGVGSFMRQNRTLYVGRCSPRADIEEVVARHFAEFGAIERIRVLTGRGVAFVTFATEALAQFAREAMHRQALDDGEVLNVRWATPDPNPVAQKREARAIEAQAAAAVKRVLPADVVAEIEGDEGAKRRRVEADFGLPGYRPTNDVWMKSQRGQVEGPPSALAVEGAEQEEDIQAEEADEEQEPRQPEAKGLLGASTLAALKGFDPTNVTRRIDQEEVKPGSALVDYGGDDDEDDW